MLAVGAIGRESLGLRRLRAGSAGRGEVVITTSDERCGCFVRWFVAFAWCVVSGLGSDSAGVRGLGPERENTGRLGPNPSLEHAIAELTGAQHNVVALGQLERLGLTDSAVRKRFACGRLHRVQPGVYAVGHGALTAKVSHPGFDGDFDLPREFRSRDAPTRPRRRDPPRPPRPIAAQLSRNQIPLTPQPLQAPCPRWPDRADRHVERGGDLAVARGGVGAEHP